MPLISLIYIYIYIYILYIYIYTHTHTCIGRDTRSSLRGLYLVFLLLDLLQYQCQRAQSALLFVQRWKGNGWITNTFPKGISAM